MFGELSGYVFLPFFGVHVVSLHKFSRYLVFTWYDCFEIGPVDLYLLYIYIFCFLHRLTIEVTRVDPIFSLGKSNSSRISCLEGGNRICWFPPFIAMWWQLKYFLFSPDPCGRFPFWRIFFQMGWFNHQLDYDATSPNFWGFMLVFPVLRPTHLGHWHFKRGSAEDGLVSKAAKQRPSCQGRCLLNFFDREFAKRSPKGCFHQFFVIHRLNDTE